MPNNVINKQSKNDGQPESSNAAKKAALPKATKPSKHSSKYSTNKNNKTKKEKQLVSK
jgi:hypothetical protein